MIMKISRQIKMRHKTPVMIFPCLSRKPPAAAKLDEEVTVTIYTFSNCIYKLYRTQLKSPKEIANLGTN